MFGAFPFSSAPFGALEEGVRQSLSANLFTNTNTFYPLSVNRQFEQNVLQGYFENRHKPPKKQEVEVPDYDEDLAVLLLMS